MWLNSKSLRKILGMLGKKKCSTLEANLTFYVCFFFHVFHLSFINVTVWVWNEEESSQCLANASLVTSDSCKVTFSL